MIASTFGFKLFKRVMLFSLLLTVIFSSCKKDSTPATPPADKTALQAKVTESQTLYTASLEGTKPGQYEVGSRTAFLITITAANAVLLDPNATQTAVTNATAQLQAALDTYKTHFIKEIAAVNLIGFWKMNGNANDSSGNANNGVVTAGHAYYGAGTPTLTADRFARTDMAYHFDHGGNIDIPYKTSLNPQQMSISLWAKWSSTGRTINTDTYTFVAMNRWNGYKFQLQSGHLPFYTVKVVKGTAVGDTTIYDRDDAGVAIAENTWRHIVVTFKSGEMKFYIDGDLVKTWDATTPNPVPGNAFTLAAPIDFVIGQDLPTNKYLTVDGDYQVAWGGFFTGDMDDVMFYNIALDGPQVKSINTNQKTL
jgi:Concanavalin A-like lectin/glucanases superfamily